MTKRRDVLATLRWAPLALAAAVSAVACATGAARPAPVPTDPAPTDPAPAVSLSEPLAPELRLGLFRVRYRGTDGRGRFRLTLRLADPERFQLSTADTFGRRLWSFELDHGASLYLDHRAEQSCRLEGDVVVRSIALSELPVASLPRVLFGDPPIAPPLEVTVPRQGEIEYVAGERRWSVRYEGGRAVSWTLWEDHRPLVWWQLDGSGGILSHRNGAQVLWRTATDERVPGDLETLTVPDGYSSGQCDADDLS